MLLKTIIGYISITASLLPLIVGLYRKRDQIWYYVALGLVSEILIKVFKAQKMVAEKNTTVNIYFLVSIFFIISYFHSHFKRRFTWLYFVVAAIYCTALVHFLFNGFYIFDGVSAAILCIIYLLYCVIALYSILDSPVIISLWKSPYFINTLAILIYHSVIFMLFALANYLQQSGQDLKILARLWMLHDVANITLMALFAKAMLLQGKATHPEPDPPQGVLLLNKNV